MASSSSRTLKYDVFPSFSGEDVRKSFLSHLLQALKRNSIISFIDNGIERSSQIAPALLSAIRQSRISIVVFSKKYASSTWCLNELGEILECHEESDQMVIPIFYDVDPSHVRKQTGEFGEAFEQTCEGKTEDEKKRWKKALAKVASIAGYDSQNWIGEAEAIELISKDVLNKLFTPSDDFRDFVGIDAHMETLNSMLCFDYGKVRMVGILGPSGIGKSTIARALYSRLSTQFHHRAFETYKRTIQDKKIADFGMKLGWARQFLSEILGQKDIKIESLGAVEQRLKHMKVLIVLDDVDEIELLETLVGQTGWFGFGSRIIVVTQDRALLESHGIDLIYEVEFPSEDLALQMFCQSAFRQTSPTDGFMELAAEVAKLAGNLPLGLNVLGSSLREKNKEYWEKMMPRLRKGLNGKIEKTLRVSYDGLDEKDDQDIFVYIACLFNGESVYYINNLLAKIFGTSVDNSLTTLADKSLVRIIGPHRIVQMHILLQKLGREIVRSESTNNPGKRRFLVDLKDISDVFENNTGTKNVLGIRLGISEIEEPLFIDDKSFEGMRNLQFINIFKESWAQTSEVRFYLPHHDLIYLPRKLRLLHWDEYPAKYIPSNFKAEHLVELIMKDSKLEKLWEGAQPLQSLKTVDASKSRHLKEIPDLSNATNLETLNLQECTSLVTLPSSIGNLKKLRELWMSGCLSLKYFPTEINLESLDYLGLVGCSRLKSFPRISKNISRLHLDGAAMDKEDCLWIENLSGLTELVWENCPLRFMPSNFHPSQLFYLVMKNSKLEKLWTGVKSLEKLEVLDLSESENLKEIPDLPTSLAVLSLNDCKSLEMLPSSFQNLDQLEAWSMSGCESLKEIPELPKATKLEELKLNNCKRLKKLPDSVRNLEELTELDMSGCTSLEDLPININLGSLTTFDISGCSRLRKLPQLPTSIEHLYLSETALEEVPSWIEKIVGLIELRMRRCEKLKTISANIWSLKHLICADFTDCGGVTSVCVNKMYLHCSDSDTEFLFHNCFSLDQDTQKFILQSYSRFTVLPGKEVPTYFTHRTCENSLSVSLPPSSLSQNHLAITTCIIPNLATDFQDSDPKIIVHWKLRGVMGAHKVKLELDSAKMDHLIVFDFNISLQEDHPSQLNCNTKVEFEFKFQYTSGYGSKETISLLPIKGCGVRVLDVSPSLEANDRISETEYQSGESDVQTETSKKPMRMTVVTSQEHSNPSDCQTLAPNSHLSSGLDGASSNFHGDGTSMYHSLSPSYPCLEGEVSVSSRLLNFFRFGNSKEEEQRRRLQTSGKHTRRGGRLELFSGYLFVVSLLLSLLLSAFLLSSVFSDDLQA